MNSRGGIYNAAISHIWGIICVVATITGVPFFYSLIAGFDLNTDLARALVTMAGVLVSGISFALGWNQRNLTARTEAEESRARAEREKAEAVEAERANTTALRNEIADKNAEIQRDKEEIVELAARWDMEKQHDSDANRILKLTMTEIRVIDAILTAEKEGKDYRHSYNTAIGNLYNNCIIVCPGDKDVYVISMSLKPYFEKYASAIHEIANGTSDDRMRIVNMIRDGTYEHELH